MTPRQKSPITLRVYDVLAWKIIYISTLMNSIYALDKYLHLEQVEDRHVQQ